MKHIFFSRAKYTLDPNAGKQGQLFCDTLFEGYISELVMLTFS